MTKIQIGSFIRLTAVDGEIRPPIQPGGEAQIAPLFLVEVNTFPSELESRFTNGGPLIIPQSGLWHFNSVAESDETSANMLLSLIRDGKAIRGISGRIDAYNRAISQVNATVYLEKENQIGRYLQVSGNDPVQLRQFAESNFLEITYLG